MNSFNKLLELAKNKLSASLTKQREIMGLGNDISQVDIYFTSPFHPDDHENSGCCVVNGSDLNKIFKTNPQSFELVLNQAKKGALKD